MTFKDLCIFARKHGLAITITPDPMGKDYPPSIRIDAQKDQCHYASILMVEELDNDNFVDYLLNHLRCSIEALLPKPTTYIEEFKKHNPHIFETSRLIYERCPGHYFAGGPMQNIFCQSPGHVECIGCDACWNQKCDSPYISYEKSKFPNDAEEVYK